MRGIILAGGTGSRLGALTKCVNKHILPVGKVPMIYRPLRVLKDNGITDITIVSTPQGVGQLAQLLGSGKDHNSKFTYCVQDQPGGIAQALSCADNDPRDCVVILGDNIFYNIPLVLKLTGNWQARCYFAPITDKWKLSELGVPEFKDGKIVNIIEKPDIPPSNYAVTGLYVFKANVFNVIEGIKLSKRNEIEITDVLRCYVQCGTLDHIVIHKFWGDAGTLDGLYECNEAMQ